MDRSTAEVVALRKAANGHVEDRSRESTPASRVVARTGPTEVDPLVAGEAMTDSMPPSRSGSQSSTFLTASESTIEAMVRLASPEPAALLIN